MLSNPGERLKAMTPQPAEFTVCPCARVHVQDVLKYPMYLFSPENAEKERNVRMFSTSFDHDFPGRRLGGKVTSDSVTVPARTRKASAQRGRPGLYRSPGEVSEGLREKQVQKRDLPWTPGVHAVPSAMSGLSKDRSRPAIVLLVCLFCFPDRPSFRE